MDSMETCHYIRALLKFIDFLHQNGGCKWPGTNKDQIIRKHHVDSPLAAIVSYELCLQKFKVVNASLLLLGGGDGGDGNGGGGGIFPQ